MPIDVDTVLAAELSPGTASWTPDQVILYHLGVGAGVPPTDPDELAYVYERALKVLPSFAVVPVFGALAGLGSLDGFDVNFAMLLHGEQDVELHAPIPATGEVTTTARITDVVDKGTGALVILETTSRTPGGATLFVNRFSLFIRGEGGFGGDGGSPAGNAPPERAPDVEVERPTLEQHGLCIFGIACKTVVDTSLEGDVEQVARYQARFAGVVLPGETLVVRQWREEGRIVLDVHTKERGIPVISNAATTLRSTT